MLTEGFSSSDIEIENAFNCLTWGNLRLIQVSAPSGSLASSESLTACTVVALGWWVSASTCKSTQTNGKDHSHRAAKTKGQGEETQGFPRSRRADLCPNTPRPKPNPPEIHPQQGSASI